MTNLIQIKYIQGIQKQFTYFFVLRKTYVDTGDFQVMIDVFA